MAASWVLALLLAAASSQTANTPSREAPPGARLQNHGQNAVTLHDSSGTKIDIVSEDPGACPGPGPTTMMRLRSAEAEKAVEAIVAKSTNVGGVVTTTEQVLMVLPMKTATLGCAAEPNPHGGKPLSTTEWKIVTSHYR